MKGTCTYKNCGHGLPCPVHTITIDATKDPPVVRIPRTILHGMTTEQQKTLRKLMREMTQRRRSDA
jgi:hypothetical protein